MSTAIATTPTVRNRLSQSLSSVKNRMILAAGLLPIPLLLLLAAKPLANLVAHFGITYELAGLVISLISAGSFVGFVFPPVIPITATVAALIAAFGAAYAIGW